MDERFVNASDDNVTSSLNSTTVSPEGSSRGQSSSVSAALLYSCTLYKFLMCGVIQLIISIIGLVGKSPVVKQYW